MKKLFLFLAIFSAISIATIYSQDNTSFDIGIKEISDSLEMRLPANSVVAALSGGAF